VCAPLQKRLDPALFDIHRRHIGDHLLLIGSTHRQVTHKEFK
jgi:hypothetical protein